VTAVVYRRFTRAERRAAKRDAGSARPPPWPVFTR
jgi:hypothetical protein